MGGEKSYSVYMLASRLGGTLDTGANERSHPTRARTEIESGSWLHEGIQREQFGLMNHSEMSNLPFDARSGSKNGWAWKIRLIEEANPDWHDR